jgi:hypothetical protein
MCKVLCLMVHLHLNDLFISNIYFINKQIFKIKYTMTGNYICKYNFDKFEVPINEQTHKPGFDKEFCRKMRNDCKPFREKVSVEDGNQIFVTSNVLEPLTFYFDGDYMRCSKTDKYVCCTCTKFEFSGGSLVFLSNCKDCAIEFTGFNTKNYPNLLHFSKSLIYPGNALPPMYDCPPRSNEPINRYHSGGGFIIVGNIGIPHEMNAVIAYHIKNLPYTRGHVEQEFI